jgi:hypothetical protein
MNNPEKMGIGYKLTILSIISLIGMIFSLILFVQSIESSLYNEKKKQTQILIESGMAIIDHYYTLEVNGQLASK